MELNRDMFEKISSASSGNEKEKAKQELQILSKWEQLEEKYGK